MIEDLEELFWVVNKNCFMYSAVFKVRFRVQKDKKLKEKKIGEQQAVSKTVNTSEV